jgi:hypothetical protein
LSGESLVKSLGTLLNSSSKLPNSSYDKNGKIELHFGSEK